MNIILLLLLGRFYWPVTITDLAHGRVKHTHVLVIGRVGYVNAHEADGDLHIRLQSLHDTTFVVAECIPKLPCRVPKVGEVVTIKGISRFDPEHGWWEIHPVEEGP